MLLFFYSANYHDDNGSNNDQRCDLGHKIYCNPVAKDNRQPRHWLCMGLACDAKHTNNVIALPDSCKYQSYHCEVLQDCRNIMVEHHRFVALLIVGVKP